MAPLNSIPSLDGKRRRASPSNSDDDIQRPEKKQARGKALVGSDQNNEADSSISPSPQIAKNPANKLFSSPSSSAAAQSNRRGHTLGSQSSTPSSSIDGTPVRRVRAPRPSQAGNSTHGSMAGINRAEGSDAATVTRFESYVVIVEVRGDEDPTNIRVIRDIKPDVELDDKAALWAKWGKFLFDDTMVGTGTGTRQPEHAGWWQQGKVFFNTMSDKANEMNDTINKRFGA